MSRGAKKTIQLSSRKYYIKKIDEWQVNVQLTDSLYWLIHNHYDDTNKMRFQLCFIKWSVSVCKINEIIIQSNNNEWQVMNQNETEVNDC
jgi:hypothetical protein